MEKEFVPYEQALALKELGFDETCIKYYWTDGMFTKTYESPFNHNKRDNLISAPLYQQAFRWFREKYGLQSYINPELSFSYNNPKYTVVFIKTIKNFTTHKDDTIWIKEGVQKKRFDTYEEAELECLKKLIQIIKKK